MAIDATAYATIEDVQRLVGDIVEDRTFTSSSFPSLADAEASINSVASELNSHLLVMEYAVPVVMTSDMQAYGWIKEANAAGAAVRLLNMMPGMALDFDQEESSTARKSSLWAQMRDIIHMIDSGRFPASRQKGRLRVVNAGAQGSPLFTRGMFDLPGTRSIS